MFRLDHCNSYWWISQFHHSGHPRENHELSRDLVLIDVLIYMCMYFHNLKNKENALSHGMLFLSGTDIVRESVVSTSAINWLVIRNVTSNQSTNQDDKQIVGISVLLVINIHDL